MLVNKMVALSTLALSFVAFSGVAKADGYDDGVNTQIRKMVEYPRLAKLREIEGTVGFSVKIDSSGAVSDVTVDSSSGASTLDNATIDAVKKAAPFSAPTGGARTVHGSVAFRLS